jgi:hypothetical protein
VKAAEFRNIFMVQFRGIICERACNAAFDELKAGNTIEATYYYQSLRSA